MHPRPKGRGILRREGDLFLCSGEPDVRLDGASKLRRKRRGMRPEEIHENNPIYQWLASHPAGLGIARQARSAKNITANGYRASAWGDGIILAKSVLEARAPTIGRSKADSILSS